MTAKEYLSQAYWLDRRINSKLEQLSSLNDIATRSTSVMSDDVVSRTRNVHAMEDVIAKIVDMKAEVNAEIDRLVDLKRDIMEVVKAVPVLQGLAGHRLRDALFRKQRVQGTFQSASGGAGAEIG